VNDPLPSVIDESPSGIVLADPRRQIEAAIHRDSIVAMTPAQARVDAVAALTTAALAKAATLQLTQDETDRLMAEFPDADFMPGAAGKENLIYLQHSAMRCRFNSVLGLGQWAVVVRESWNEDFETKGYAGKPPQKGVRVYVRGMMLVRGCYVGEAVGDMDYYPGNAAQNYGDAFEGAKTAAFRRCAKEFGVGVQAWDKHWCEGWWQRKRGAPTQQRPVTQATPTPRAPAAKPLTPDERKAKLIAALKGYEPEANAIFREEGLSMENENFTEISTTRIECMSPDNMLVLIKQVKQRKADSDHVPDAEVHETPADAIEGTLEDTNAKTDKGKNGKPYTRYGFKIDGVWHNTFSRTLFEAARPLKGQQVLYTAKAGDYGSDLLTIEAAGEVVP